MDALFSCPLAGDPPCDAPQARGRWNAKKIYHERIGRATWKPLESSLDSSFSLLITWITPHCPVAGRKGSRNRLRRKTARMKKAKKSLIFCA
jgi:hypothetical protein